jgi:hypothetical protein
MREIQSGGVVCFPAPTQPKGTPPSHPTGPEPNPPGKICVRLSAHRLELSKHASAEVDLDPGLADVSILFSVHELADQLSDHELRKGILSSVTGGIEAIAAKLPPGVELHFKGNVFKSRDATD